LLSSKSTAEVTKGVTGRVVETDADAAIQKAAPVVGTSLEGACGGD
jgi:hypothetical protein